MLLLTQAALPFVSVPYRVCAKKLNKQVQQHLQISMFVHVDSNNSSETDNLAQLDLDWEDILHIIYTYSAYI